MVLFKQPRIANTSTWINQWGELYQFVANIININLERERLKYERAYVSVYESSQTDRCHGVWRWRRLDVVCCATVNVNRFAWAYIEPMRLMGKIEQKHQEIWWRCGLWFMYKYDTCERGLAGTLEVSLLASEEHAFIQVSYLWASLFWLPWMPSIADWNDRMVNDLHSAVHT